MADHPESRAGASARSCTQNMCGQDLPCELLKTLCEISSVLARGEKDRRKLFSNIFEVLASGLGMTKGTLMLMTADGNELVFEEAQPAMSRIDSAVRYRRGEGITGHVLETARSVVVPSLAADPRFKGRIHRREKGEADHGFICVPVVIETETVGTLSVDVGPGCSGIELREGEMILTIVAGMIAHDVWARRMARLDREVLQAENRRLREELLDRSCHGNMIGNSDKMRDVLTRMYRVAPTDTTVLIRGESGTGKELAAAAIHSASQRSGKPFVKVNCAALNESLIESELFGHEKGAFTGALFARAGRLEEAEGGTLFLDEIGDFSPVIQAKLLRVLQEREYARVGSNDTRKADVRIVAATNRNLEEAVQAGDFRVDLYYRINVFAVHLPALRRRKEDVLLLANYFVKEYAEKMGKTVKRISTPAINMLMAYHWPGNIRELENCIEHAVLLTQDEVIHGHDLPPTLQFPEIDDTPGHGTLKDRVQVIERDLIADSLKRNHGNVRASGRELGITDRMVRYKIEKLGIDESLFRKRRSPRGDRKRKRD